MAATMTVKLVDATNVTATLSTISSLPEAKQAVQQWPLNKGFFDDAGTFHPSSAIVSITIAIT